MKRPMTAIVIVLTAVAFLCFGLHLTRKARVERMRTNGWVAPDFDLQGPDGTHVRLSDYRGKAVLLNFWATWCGPCKIEIPWWIDLQNQYQAKGMQVVGVAMDDSGKEDIVKFATQLGVNYPLLIGTKAVRDAYKLGWNLPTTYLIDRQGRVVEHILGLAKASLIYDNVEALLNTEAKACPADSSH